MPEGAYGYWDSGPVRGGGSRYLSTLTATNAQLGKLTDVLHHVGIIREDEKIAYDLGTSWA